MEGADRAVVYAFGDFRLDVSERLLLRHDEVVPLTPKAFDLLTYLAARPGRLLDKCVLLDAVWPGISVEEANLAFQVSVLRRILDVERPPGSSLIQTVPTKGYRFTANVRIVARGVGRHEPLAPAAPEALQTDPWPSDQPQSASSRLDPAEVRSELARILSSAQFTSSERLRSFLSFVVEHALSGSAAPLKEYAIGLHVYQRGPDFDPKLDSIVRSEANRLRSKLSEYYRVQPPGAIRIDLPRGGYAPTFTPAGGHSSSRESPASTVPSALVSGAAVASRSPRPLSAQWSVVTVAALLACLLGGAVFMNGSATRSRRERQDVLITPLVNLTGNRDLQHELESHLEAAVSAAPDLNIVPPARVKNALFLMARPETTALTPEAAREVSVRDARIRGIVSGVVARTETGYRVDISLVDPRTDQALTAMRVHVRLGDISSGMDRVAARIERALVEMPPARQSEGTLEPVVTSSLSALRSYTRAMALARSGKWEPTEMLLRDALTDDPDFASAHVMLAWTLLNLDRPADEWRVELDRSVALSSRATEREQLFIRASAFSLHGDDTAAMAVYEALLATDPDDFWSSTNLAFHSSRLDPARTSLYYARTADQRPRDFEANLEAAWNLALDGRPSESARYADRAKASAGPADAAFAIDVLAANAAWLAGEPGEARAIVTALDKQAATTERGWYAEAVGLPALGLGLLDLAEGAIGRWDDPVAKHRWLSWAAVAREDVAAFDREAAALVDTRVNPMSAIILIRAGEIAAARRMLVNRPLASVPFARSTQLLGLWQVVDGELALAEDREPAGVSHLQAGFESLENSIFPEYFIAAERLAGLLRRRGDIARARTILDRAVSHRQQAFLHRLFFWRRCAEALVSLDEHVGQTARSAAVAAELDAILGRAHAPGRPDAAHPGTVAPISTR